VIHTNTKGSVEACEKFRDKKKRGTAAPGT